MIEQTKIENGTTVLETLPQQNEELRASIAKLQAAQTPDPSLPQSQTLPLSETLELLAKREEELALLNHKLEMATTALPGKVRREESLTAELQMLETRTAGVKSSAREAQRKKEARMQGISGDLDDMEARGRWYRAVEAGIKATVE
jgi:hypothetical protein